MNKEKTPKKINMILKSQFGIQRASLTSDSKKTKSIFFFYVHVFESSEDLTKGHTINETSLTQQRNKGGDPVKPEHIHYPRKQQMRKTKPSKPDQQNQILTSTHDNNRAWEKKKPKSRERNIQRRKGARDVDVVSAWGRTFLNLVLIEKRERESL